METVEVGPLTELCRASWRNCALEADPENLEIDRLEDAIAPEARLSLALAIDMLWPCHWRFAENLRLVMAAIGGDLEPDEPFAACGRNISMRPGRPRLEVVCRTLQRFCGASSAGGEIDEALLEQLGDPTPSKRWLAASLDKTIRLQLDPPAVVAELSSLSGPDWAVQANPG